jgi:hypothetical protein
MYADGPYLVLHDPFGVGVDIRFHYDPLRFAQRYEFTQAARDTLKALWQIEGDNTLKIATIMRIDLDSMNISLRRLGKIFTGGDLGDHDVLELRGQTYSVYQMPSWVYPDNINNPIEGNPGVDIAVNRRVVKTGGAWYLAEVVDPVKMNQRALGTIMHDASVIFQEDGTADDSTEDNFIQDGAKPRNHGAHTVGAFGFYSSVDKYRETLKWPNFQDEGSFVATDIDSCHCSVYVYANTGGWTDTTYMAHEMTTDWTEGTGKASNSYNDEPDWVYYGDSASGYSWTTEGGDFQATAFDTFTCNGVSWYGIVIPTSRCSLWCATPDSNMGFMVKAFDEGGHNSIRYMYSSENSGSNKPFLIVWHHATAAVTPIFRVIGPD